MFRPSRVATAAVIHHHRLPPLLNPHRPRQAHQGEYLKVGPNRSRSRWPASREARRRDENASHRGGELCGVAGASVAVSTRSFVRLGSRPAPRANSRGPTPSRRGATPDGSRQKLPSCQRTSCVRSSRSRPRRSFFMLLPFLAPIRRRAWPRLRSTLSPAAATHPCREFRLEARPVTRVSSGRRVGINGPIIRFVATPVTGLLRRAPPSPNADRAARSGRFGDAISGTCRLQGNQSTKRLFF